MPTSNTLAGPWLLRMLASILKPSPPADRHRRRRVFLEPLEARLALTSRVLGLINPILEPIGSQINSSDVAEVIMDNQSLGYSEIGAGWSDGGLAGGYGGDYRFNRPGDPSSVATWTFSDLPSASYEVFATWTAHPNRASGAPFSVIEDSTVRGSVQLNQKAAPSGEQAIDHGWESLGEYRVNSGTLTVKLANAADGIVIADAIRVVRRPLSEPRVIDDHEVGYSESSSSWLAGGLEGGYQEDYRFSRPGGDVGTASWTFSDLPTGMFSVYTTWTSHLNRATNALFTVLDGLEVKESLRRSQQVPPDDAQIEGHSWEHLGDFQIASGGLTVELSNAANGVVVADAILLFAVPPRVLPGAESVRLSIDSTRLTESGTATVSATIGSPSDADVVIDLGVSGTATSGIDFVLGDSQIVIPTGQTKGSTTVSTIDDVLGEADETVVVDIVDVSSGAELGIQQVALTIEDNDNLIIDDRDVGYLETGLGWLVGGLFGGYGGDYRFSRPTATASSASWSFAGLPIGDYEVLATWTPHENRASNAIYTILDGGAVLSNVQRDQRLAPDDELASSYLWESLGQVHVTTSVLNVRLNNNADGVVIADAVLLKPLAAPPNTLPVLKISDGQSIQPGGTLAITTAMLAPTDSARPPDAIRYTLRQGGFSGLLTGHVAFAAAPDVPISEFTQADVDAGLVIYRDGFNGSIMPEIRVDRFAVIVSDPDGNQSGPIGFLVERALPELQPQDETYIWRPGDGSVSIDAGDGDDAFVLYGGDAAHTVTVRPSADGTEVVFDLESETIRLDGIEDLYILLGPGENLLDIAGDFTGTDLSPSTIFVQDNDLHDLSDLDDLYDVRFHGDVILHAGGGRNSVTVISAGILASAGQMSDSFRLFGFSGFESRQVQLFPGGGTDTVTSGRAENIHLEEFFPSELMHQRSGGQSRYFADLELLSDAYVLIPDSLVRLQHNQLAQESELLIGNSFLIDEPQASSGGFPLVEQAPEILDTQNSFLLDSSPVPLPPDAYQIVARTDVLLSTPTALIGSLPGLGSIGGPPANFEVLVGSDLDDLIFAGDSAGLADADFAFDALTGRGDSLHGLHGNDLLVGDRKANLILGGSGHDRLEGRRGDDELNGGPGHDTIDAGPGDDLIWWSSGEDSIDGGDDFDVVDFSIDPFPGDDLPANAGPLSISPLSGGGYQVSYTVTTLDLGGVIGPFNVALINVEEIIGAATSDIMSGGSLADRFLAGDGDDQVHGDGGADHLDGGSGDDRINGGAGEDTIVAGPGDDEVDGGAGNDMIDGVSGENTLFGGSGADYLNGGNHSDVIDGGVDQDTVLGGAGNDVGLFHLGEIGTGNDEYDGGTGLDTLRVVIDSPASLSQEQVSGLQELGLLFGATPGARTIAALRLTFNNWETLEIVDRFGQAIDLDELNQDAPTDIHLSNLTVDEGSPGAKIGQLTVDDPDIPIGDTHAFDLSDSRFEIRNGDELFLKTGIAIDFEVEPVVNLTIGATDLGGNRVSRGFSLQVLDVLDTPFPPTDIRLSSSTVREESQGQAISLVEVDDLNQGDVHNFTFDDPRFEVVDGILKLVDSVSIDFEAEMSVVLSATAVDRDGLTFTESFTIDVIDVDESATPFTLPNSFADVDGINSFALIDVDFRRQLGVSADSTGDMTGDGIDDLIVTSVQQQPQPPSIAGIRYAYLLPGGNPPLPAHLHAVAPHSMPGTSIFLPLTEDGDRTTDAAGIGDFNGDGLNDLVIGVGKAETAGSVFEGGQVFVVLGRPGGLPNGQSRPQGAFFDIDLTDNSTFDGSTVFRIEGAVTHERLGTTVSSAGDVDGDGLADILIGYSDPSSGFGNGGALLVYGNPTPLPTSIVSDDFSGLRTTRISSGTTVTIGDVNADGLDDLFISVDTGMGNGTIIFGTEGGLAESVDPTTSADVLIAGGLNRAVTLDPGIAGRAGDVNGDGIEDLYVITQTSGAPLSTNNEVIVFYGRSGWPGLIDLGSNDGSGANGSTPIPYLTDGNGMRIVPGGDFGRLAGNETFSSGVVAAGDINGDGNDDLLVRVSRRSTATMEHVLLFGNPFLPTELVLDPMTLTTQLGVPFGFPIADGYSFDEGMSGRIDYDGDGFDDLVFGDPVFPFTTGDIGMLFVALGGDLSGFVAQPGTEFDDFLVGGSGADLLVGGSGDDTLIGRGSRDVYSGGLGDDLIVVGGTGVPEYVRIDGGGGIDTVRLAGDSLVWDLGTSGNSPLNPAGTHALRGIDIIDLGRGQSGDPHTLIMNQLQLLALPDAADPLMQPIPDTRSLIVIGDEMDTVNFSGQLVFDRVEMRNGLEFKVFTVTPLVNFELFVSIDIIF